MSITAISGSTSNVYQASPLSSVQPATSGGQDSDGDGDGGQHHGRVSRSRGLEGAQFISTILQSLTQAGVGGASTATADTSASPSGTSPQQTLNALGSFIQNLLAAMKSQTDLGTNPAVGSGDPQSQAAQEQAIAGNASATAGTHGHHHDGMGKFESALQSLVAQLSSPTGAQAGTTTTDPAVVADGTSASGTGSSSALSLLQQSYQGLLGALDARGNSPSLGGFLQVLAQNMQGRGPTGNIVYAQA